VRIFVKLSKIVWNIADRMLEDSAALDTPWALTSMPITTRRREDAI
jgi:hypothetical protein